MNKFDPTTPIYQQNVLSKKSDPLEDLMKDVFNYIKVSNSKAFYAWDDEAYAEAVEIIKDTGMSLPHLRQAFQRLKGASESPTFPLFKSTVSQLKTEIGGGHKQYKAATNPDDWREVEMVRNARHQERLKAAPKSGSRDIKAYWMSIISSDLKKGGGMFRSVPSWLERD